MLTSRARRGLAAVLVTGAAGGAVLGAAAPALAKTTVKETLSDFKIAGAGKAKPGVVVFKVKNAADMKHELVVIKTSRKAAQLPTKNGKAVETGAVGEVELGGGKAATLRVQLAKGHYALICNIGEHYAAGMRKDFKVG